MNHIHENCILIAELSCCSTTKTNMAENYKIAIVDIYIKAYPTCQTLNKSLQTMVKISEMKINCFFLYFLIHSVQSCFISIHRLEEKIVNALYQRRRIIAYLKGLFIK